MADVNEWIDSVVKANDVVLFMKGTPEAPQCGFSSRVTQMLGHLDVPYQAIDVLENSSLREGIKAYTNWPTIPQLYVKGEFIGGCDIITEMFQNGELKKTMDDSGVAIEA